MLAQLSQQQADGCSKQQQMTHQRKEGNGCLRNDRNARRLEIAQQIQHQTSTSAAHAHDAGDAQVQMAGLLREDLARSAVHEDGAKAQGFKCKIQPRIHLAASFLSA